MPDATDSTLYQGSATDYLASHPTPQPDPPQEGGLFGETLGAKVARGLLYVVPIAGQIVARKEQQKAAQASTVNEMILTGALKAQDPELLQSPEVQKAAKGMFGNHGATFLGVATHIAQHQKDTHTGFIKLLLKHGYGQPGVDPRQVMRDAAAEATKTGQPIPNEAQSLIAQHVMKPVIAAATTEAQMPGKIATAAGQQQARETVKNAPENVGARAAGKAYETGEVEKAKQPFEQARHERNRAEKLADIAHAESTKAAEADRKHAQSVLDDARKTGEKHVPKAVLDTTVALTQKGELLALPPDTTYEDLDHIRASGGTVHTKTWYDTLSGVGTFQQPRVQLKKNATLTPAEQADQYLKNLGGGQ